MLLALLYVFVIFQHGAAHGVLHRCDKMKVRKQVESLTERLDRMILRLSELNESGENFALSVKDVEKLYEEIGQLVTECRKEGVHYGVPTFTRLVAWKSWMSIRLRQLKEESPPLPAFPPSETERQRVVA